MYVLVINAGSSSIKFGLHDGQTQEAVATGEVAKIGEAGAYIDFAGPSGRSRCALHVADHAEGFDLIFEMLVDSERGVLGSLDEIQAIGHRVVHGGSTIGHSMVIDDDVIERIRECIPFAPLHNPAHLAGILECRRLLPDTPQVVIPDTAFHQTVPPYAYMYAIPYEFYEKYGARRYGFHGSSYRFVSRRAAEMMGGLTQDYRMVVCHLGNGSSMAAIKHGRSVDTTMGFTPAEGLMMGTRSGDIDLGLVLEMIAGRPSLSAEQVDRILNKESGILGISGVSNDMREVSAHAEAGDQRCLLALDMYSYRIKKYVGAYAAAMGGIDLLVFSGGIGANNAYVRQAACHGLEFLGIAIDHERNKMTLGVEGDISAEGAKVRVLVVPTNEEAILVEDTLVQTSGGA